MSTESIQTPENLVPAAALPELERLLSERFGCPVRIASQKPLKIGRTIVVRLVLTGAPVSSAICRFGNRDGTLWNELAGMRFLSEVPKPPRAVPSFYGGGPIGTDMAAVMSEDIGSADDLAELLLRGTAAQARAGLEGYVDALLHVHVATFGRYAEHARIRAEYEPGRGIEELLRSGSWRELEEAIEQVGPGLLPDGVAAAVSWIDEVLSEESWWAFTLHDCCPDNNKVGPDGRVRLFDMEFAGCRHVLLDLAYVRTVMPTCWCMRRLPNDLSAHLVDRYRAQLLAARPELSAADFDAGLAAAQAYWGLTTLGWHLSVALNDPAAAERRYLEEVDFTMASRRDMANLRLADLTTVASERTELAPVGKLASRLTGQLEKIWPVRELLPLYPAFGGQAHLGTLYRVDDSTRRPQPNAAQ